MLGAYGLIALGVVWAAGYALVRWLASKRPAGRRWDQDWVALGVLLLVTLGFYWPLFFGNSWIPKGGGDLASFIYPTYAFAARWLRRGVVPLWNPHLYLGMPFAADNQSGLFYPVNLAFALLLPRLTYEAVELMAVLHVFLAGTFAYVLLCDLPGLSRRLGDETGPTADPGGGRLAATGGAIAFMFSDLFVVHPGNLNIIATAAWLPLALFCFRRAIARRGLAWSAWTGIVLGVAALAGHAQMFLYLVLAVSMYAAFHAYLGRKDGWQGIVRPLLRLTFAGIVAFGLSALALIPAADLVKYTVRAEMTYAQASDFAVPPAGLIGLVMPGFFGRGTGPFWGPWARTEVGYIGVLPLLLAWVAVALSWRRSTLTRFWTVLAVVGLLMALGPWSIVHGLAYAALPVFRQVRVPARAVLLFDLAVSALAGVGLAFLVRPLGRMARERLGRLWRAASLLVGGATLVGLPVLGHAVLSARMRVPADVLAQHVTSLSSLVVFLLLATAGVLLLSVRLGSGVRPRFVGMLAVVLIALDLLSLGAYLEVEPNDPLIAYRHERAVSIMRSETDPFRVETTAEVQGEWAPDWALLEGLDDVSGIWNPLRLGAYDVLTWVGIQRGERFYDLYNARYVIARRDAAVPAHFERVLEEGDHALYRNPRALPRAYLVHEVVLASGDIDALTKARAPAFDPTRQVVLKESGGPRSLSAAPGTGTGQVAFVGRSPNHIDLLVDAPADGYLFLGEMWMPGWFAEVDGAREDVLQANYTFRAVFVPEGSHQVRLFYRPLSWLAGLTVTGLTLAALLAWMAWALAVRRRAVRGEGA